MTKQELEQHNYYLVDTYINLNASMADMRKEMADLQARADMTLADMRDVAEAIRAFDTDDGELEEEEDLDDGAEEVLDEPVEG